MSDAQLIGRRQRETPGDSRSTSGNLRRLPPDLLRQASKRLQTLALIGAVLWILGPGLGHLAAYLTSPQDPTWGHVGPTDAVAAVSCLIGLGLYWYLQGRERNPTFILDLPSCTWWCAQQGSPCCSTWARLVFPP